MSTALSSQVVMGPLNFDLPPDYLGLQYDLDTDKLDQTLVKLSQTIAKNAKVTNSVKDEIAALRAHIDNSVAKLQRSLQVVDDAGRAVKEQVLRVYDEVKALQGSSVRRQEYDVDKDLTWKEINHVTSFIAEYKETNGHMSRVQDWVKSYVPEWYAHVQGAMNKNMHEALMKAKEETRDAIIQDVAEMQHRAMEAAKISHAVLESRFDGLDAKLRAHEARFEEVDVKHARQVATTSLVSAGHDELKERLRELAQEFAEGQLVQDTQLEAALLVLGFTVTNVNEFVEISAGAESLPMSATPTAVASERQSPNTIGGLMPPRGPRKGSVMSTDDADPNARRQSAAMNTSIPFALPSEEMIRSRGKHRGGPGVVKLRDPEAAAAFVAALPAFRLAQAHIVGEAKQLVSDVASKANAQVQAVAKDVQIQLSDKVGVSKLKDLLEKNKDDKLYWSVDNLQREVTNLKETKVDAARFDSAISAKADKATVDEKADKQFVNTAISHSANKADSVASEVESLRDQLKDALQSIRAMKAGGGGQGNTFGAGSSGGASGSGGTGADGVFGTSTVGGGRSMGARGGAGGALYDATQGPQAVLSPRSRGLVGDSPRSSQRGGADQGAPGTAPSGSTRPQLGESVSLPSLTPQHTSPRDDADYDDSPRQSNPRANGRPPRQRGRGRGRGRPAVDATDAPDSQQLPTPPAVHELGLGDVLHRLTHEEFVYGQRPDPRLVPPPGRTGSAPRSSRGPSAGRAPDAEGYSAPPE